MGNVWTLTFLAGRSVSHFYGTDFCVFVWIIIWPFLGANLCHDDLGKEGISALFIVMWYFPSEGLKNISLIIMKPPL